MDTKEAHKRILAARTLLLEPTTTRDKFNSIATLIQGINPTLDRAVARAQGALGTIDKVFEGAVIELTAEHLPENTEEEKRRKKLVLFFIRTWKDLQSEVTRVEQALNSQGNSQNPTQNVSTWGKIFGYAKGPLGLVTVVALSLGVMHQTSIQMTIQNKGCPTMHVSSSIPISLPGLSLPTKPIASGDSSTLVIPPFVVNIDGTKSGSLALKALHFSLSFQLPSTLVDVTLDGISLLGKTTEVHLSEKEQHTLVLRCS